LDEQGNAYLSDFGIAKDRLRTPDLTQTDAITGSPAYISPEQIQEGPVTPLADIYSLGVLLYELLTGAHPFPDQVLATLLLKHLNESLPMVAVLRPDLPPAVAEVIQRATAKDPAQRFPDAMTLADAFRQALATDAVMVSPLVGVPLPEPTNPYKGLRPFLEADAADFFGREALTDELLGHLAETEDAARFLAVVGPSGSGKSSIVRAGLVPALRRGALPGSEDWFVVQMLPGAHPLEELEAALLRVAVNPPETLLKQMRADERGLIRAVKRCLPEDSGELLLVIDQFEELFTLVEEERDRTHFLDSLQAAVTDPRSPVRLVVTLRADFYDRPLGYAGFGELTRQSTAVVLPLSPAELERAIVGPAERVGVSLEPGLVAEIVADVTEQPGGLPLLQYALTELFEGREDRTLLSEAYHAIGGVLGALGRRAEELYQGLDIKGQEAARQLFLRLITLGEGIEDTRRRVLRAELEGLTADERRSTAEGNGREDTVVSGQRSAVVQHVIELYGRYRLLTFDRDPVTRGPTVEVAHEALLREWRRLREWLDKDREFLLWHQRLRAALHQWEASERDAGALLRGAPLAEADNWLHQRLSDLTATERAFIQAGLDLREREAAEREAQRHRELEAARKLAQAEKARAEEQAYAAGRLRRRALFLAGALGAAAILAIAALFFGRQASRNEQKALAQRAIAVTEAEKRATAQAQTEIERAEAQNVALVAGSQAALANNDTDAALTLAWQAVTLNPDSALAQAQLSEVAYTPGTVRRYVGHTDGVFTLAISPDGRTLLSGSDDKTVILWNLETGEILKQLEGHTTWLNDVAFGPDGQMAASVSDEMTILWDVQTGRIIRQFDGHEGPIARIAFSPDGQNIVTGDRGDDAILIQWDVESGEILRRFEGSSRVTDIEFTPDGSAFLSASSDGILILWDFESGEIIHELNLHNENPEATVGSVRATAISPDGLTAAIGTESLGIILWDLSTGALLQSHAIPGGANTVVFHPEKDTALVGGLHYLIDVDLQTGEILNTYAGHHDSVWDVGITSNGRYAVSASFDKTLRLWELERGHVIRRFAPAGALAFEVDLSPDGRTALSGSIDGTVTLWDVETGDKIRQFTDDQPVMAVTYSPDGKTALIGTGYRLAEKVESGHVILWDVGTGEVLRQFMGHPYVVFDVEFSPDGKRAVSSGNGPVAILWDVETGQEIRRFDDYFIDSPWPTESFWDVKFSPDGSAVLASFSKGSLIMWDVETGAEIGQLVGHVDAGATGITFSEDGQRVVSGGFDSQAILWDMETRSIVRRFTNHAGPIGQVGFTPDEHLMLGGSGDGANSLWDVETGEEIRRYGNGFVVKPVFNSDGSQALVGFHDGAVELWRMDTTLDELLEWTQANRYIPELTCNQRELYRIEPLCGPAD
jgi:WD40 repeat protein